MEEGETVILAISKKYPEVRTTINIIVVGEMSAEEINFVSPLKINGLEVSGLDVNKNTVNELKSKIITEFELEFFNNKGEELKDTDIVGTGGKIVVKKDDKILREYKIILYGDINGDGKINGIDLLVLQRHILEIEKIEGIYLKSANIRKNQGMPNSIDLLLIQRHILEIQFISQ